jgi:steroid 5-alpha reductase family enzyme
LVAELLSIWGVCLAGFAILWAVSAVRRDVSLIDIFWGPGFVAGALLVFWRAGLRSPWHLVHLAMVLLWGIRLALHIAVRGHGHGEDRRYAAMREKNGPRFVWLSLFTVFWLQATLVALLSAPLVVVQREPIERSWAAAIGAGVWLLGFLFEAIGDAQLLAFQRDPASRGKVLNTGLWRYTRHPNYFGEACLWWGFGLFALAVAGGAWTLYAPLATTFLLLRVSGVPMLEAGIEARRPGYREYIERTSSFVPWFPKSAAGAQRKTERR